MSRHVIEIAEEERVLSLSRGFLVVSDGTGGEVGRVPLDDVQAVIVSAPRGMLSKPVMTALTDRGATIVLGGANYHPAAMLLPIAGHHETAGVQIDQIEASKPLCKRLWQGLIRAKIEAQAWALARAGPTTPDPRKAAMVAGHLVEASKRVKSGDPDNVEAQAAKDYWPALMGSDFRRDTGRPGVNAHLNYGYAVLRAAVARAVVAAGLNPALGVHHRSRVNPFCLVDDLMEPFRPLVDEAVHRLGSAGGGEVCVESKRALAAILDRDLETEAGASPVRVCAQRLAQSLAQSFRVGEPNLMLFRLPDAKGML